MKRISILFVIVLSLLFYVAPLQAQIFKQSSMNSRQIPNNPNYDNAKLHWGFVLAPFTQRMYFSYIPKVDYTNIIYKGDNLPVDIPAPEATLNSLTHRSHTAFSVGLVGSYRLAEYFDLRFVPSMAFGSRDLIYDFAYVTAAGAAKTHEITKTISSTIIDFPILLKYKSKRIHNMRAYIIGGGKYSLDLAYKQPKQEDAKTDNEIIRLNPHTFSFELGAGMDFYAFFFKFGIEAKMAYSLNNILKYDAPSHAYFNGIDRLNSKVFQLSLTFE
ncbi:MAG: PorT family protein [Bacteroidales bacterium]|nr:PorT family protein [Bacteroidales bacterium]